MSTDLEGQVWLPASPWVRAAQIPISQLYRLVATHRVRTQELHGKIRYSVEDLRAFLAEREAEREAAHQAKTSETAPR